MPGCKERSRQHPLLSLSSPPSTSRQHKPGRRRRRLRGLPSRGGGGCWGRDPKNTHTHTHPRGEPPAGEHGEPGRGRPGGAARTPRLLQRLPRPRARCPPGPERGAAASWPERGHGLPDEPAEQPGGGELRGALRRQAGGRPGRLPPLLPASSPAEAARGAAESLAGALRAAGGVAAGDPGHHPGAQAGARRAHPPAA